MSKKNSAIVQRPEAQSSEPTTGNSQRPVKPNSTTNVKK